MEENKPEDHQVPLERIMRLQYYFGSLNAINWTLCLGAPLVLLAGEWGADSFQIGVLASFIYIFSPVQILANVQLGRLGCKTMMLSGWSLRNLFILPIPLTIVFFGLDQAGWKIYMLILCFACFGLFRSIGLTAHLPWIYGLIPPQARGRFMSNYMMIVNLSGSVIFILSALVFYLFSDRSAFAMVFFTSLMSGFIAAFVLSQVPDVEKPDSVSLKQIGRYCLQYISKPSPFRRVTFIGICYYIFAGPLISFLIYYVSTEGIFTSDRAMLMALLNFLGGIVGSWLSRLWLDLLGIRFFSSIVLGGLSGLMAILFALIWVKWSHQAPIPGIGMALYVIAFIAGAFFTVWYTITVKMQPYVTAEKTRALQVSIFYATGTLSAGLSSMLWGGLFRIPMEGGKEINIYLLLIYIALAGVAYMMGSVLMARLNIQEAVPRPINFLARLFPKK